MSPNENIISQEQISIDDKQYTKTTYSDRVELSSYNTKYKMNTIMIFPNEPVT